MTWFQEVFTPGRPLYWAMLCIPNGLVLLWALVQTFRSRWFLLVGAAAMHNVLVPWMGQVIFSRNNGINAPGTPHWFDMLTVVLWSNGQTLCLLMLVPVLIAFKAQHDRK